MSATMFGRSRLQPFSSFPDAEPRSASLWCFCESSEQLLRSQASDRARSTQRALEAGCAFSALDLAHDSSPACRGASCFALDGTRAA